MGLLKKAQEKEHLQKKLDVIKEIRDKGWNINDFQAVWYGIGRIEEEIENIKKKVLGKVI